MIVENLFNSIERGRTGLNTGLSSGFPKLDKIVYGVQRRWLTIYAGDSGSGKSSLVLYSQIYQPFQQYYKYKNINIHFLIFSFEMSSEVLLAKLLSLYIYDTFHKILSYGDILSLGTTLSDENYEYIKQSTPWLQEFEHHCTIIDKPVTAKGLYGIIKSFTEEYGNYELIETTSGYKKENYIPKNPDQYLITVVDHIKLLSVSPNHTSKQEIDEACDYLIYFRNKCNLTVNIIQQLNRNFKSMDRRQGGYQLLQLDDLSDSSGPAQAAETVIGIFHPYREKMSRCENYDIRQLKDNFRLLQILKNRFGEADKSFGVAFYGINGLWQELPMPDKINDYSKFKL